MAFLKEKIRILCENLSEQMKQPCGELGPLEYVRSGYKHGNTPPENGWCVMDEKTELEGVDAHYWVRASFHTPSVKENEYLILEALTGKEGQWDATNPQGLLYLNGEMVQGYDTNHTEAYLEPDTKYQMHNYMYLGMQADPIRLRMRICRIDRRIEQLYYDILVPYEACQLMSENSDEYIAMMGVLEQAANQIDMREIFSDAYYRSIEAAERLIQTELYEKLCSKQGKPVVNFIGHTHIDMEWLWTRAQTREKIQRSFSTAASLMKRYPEFKFMLSQPELYQYLKEEAPEKYAELKKLVADGRWEPEGAMWLEPDCNLSSGESFVRQLIHGMRFFKEEFGTTCKVLFLPDVFGYSAALPQILKKAGIDYFVTSKISWNETNKLPVDEFLWQGIDGTEIFTTFLTAQDYEGPEAANYTLYVGNINSSMLKGAWNRFQQKEYSDRVMVTFGYGDGGGGPTKQMLEQFRRLEKGLPGLPVAEMGFMTPHLEQRKQLFDAGCKRTQRTPKWVGELYLEFHRGTYTSIAKNKRNNRKSELMLQKAEALSYTDFLHSGSYDADGIYGTWKKVLHNQFHDILPGSSIFEVYEGTDRDYAEVQTFCENTIQDKLHMLASKVTADSGVLVYNSLGFARKAMVRLDGKTVELPDEIPAFGWKVISDVRPYSGNGVEVCGNTLKNRYYEMRLGSSGRIESLFDRRAEREVFRDGAFGNELQVFEDYPRQYDAWEMTDYYKQKMWILDTPAEITPVFDGARAGVQVVKRYMHSTITQKIWLYSGSPRIDFETEIDWHEKHQILKAAFPLAIHANNATFDIQFGHVVRPTHENTSWDKARFESYGHKWVDVSENGYGVSLLNDCKYGYNTEGSTLKLTMLKCATYPNPHADEGKHIFTYSLLPHIGDFREAGVIQEAYSLNQPLEAVHVNSGDGTLPGTYSLVSSDSPNVMIETVKKAEVDGSMIVRLYEAFDRRSKAVISVAEGFKKAYLCNLLEDELEKLPFDGTKLPLPVRNFEIITLKFTRE